MSEAILRKSRASENFNTKAKIMGLSLESKVDILNNMYKNKLLFTINNSFYDYKPRIKITILDKSIKMIELPEVEELDFEDLFNQLSYSAGMVSIKFPKCMPKTSVHKMHYLHAFDRAWFWDDTVCDLDRVRDVYWSRNKMIIIQYNDNRKPTVYHI